MSENRVLDAVLRWARPIACLAHLGAFASAGVLAFALRFDGVVPEQYVPHFWFALAIWTTAKFAVFELSRLNRGWWRYASTHDLYRLIVANLAGSAFGAAAILLIAPSRFPRSLYALDFLMSFLLTAGLRVAMRIIIETAKDKADRVTKCRTLIYGAGDAGVTLLREVRGNTLLPYQVVGFVDDDPRKSGLSIHGARILGTGEHLREFARKHRVQTVLIAIPSATGEQMTTVLRHCQAAGVAYKTVPGLSEVIVGNGLAKQIRDVAVEDLLGRRPVRLEEAQIEERLAGRVVLVTGAAGSIGSELCRQIARFQPTAIVGFDVAESPLFEIEGEMQREWPDIAFHAEIGSIQNRARLEEVFREYGPTAVFHAAAYKHVPMMETHVFEAVENNIFGTWNVAMIAAEFRVEDFVLISSDKAVRPVNVMGATKRVAELVVQGLQNGRTKYVAVRFGNVLGSNGSVIPIFKRQIAAGGPVTVTHPDMRRYFMTIPEACQLVLQASATGLAGQICVLDMGEPVKIVDLATNLILLSGLRPGEDVEVEFTGVRPGEKLYEELNSVFEDTVATGHEKIRVFVGSGLADRDIAGWIKSLREKCECRDLGGLVLVLKEMVPDYSPSMHLLKRVVKARGRAAVVGD